MSNLFLNLIGPWAELVTSWLLTYAMHSTIFLGLVLIIALMLPREWVQIKELILRLALVGAIVTTVFQIGTQADQVINLPIGAGNIRSSQVVSGVVPVDVAGDEQVWLIPEGSEYNPVMLQPLDTSSASVSLSSEEMGGAAWENLRNRIGSSWPVLLLAIWVCGLILLGTRYILQWWSLLLCLENRVKVVDGPILNLVDQIQRQTGGSRNYTVYRCPGISGLMALGTATICLPGDFTERFSEEEQLGALAHEMAHLRRNDPLWRIAFSVIGVVFFFQPLNRIVSAKLRETAEYLCDQWAVVSTGNPAALVKALLKSAVGHRLELVGDVAPTIRGRKSSLSERTSRMFETNQRINKRIRLIAVFGALAAVVAIGMLSPRVVIAKRAAKVLTVPLDHVAEVREPARLHEIGSMLQEVAQRSPLRSVAETAPVPLVQVKPIGRLAVTVETPTLNLARMAPLDQICAVVEAPKKPHRVVESSRTVVCSEVSVNNSCASRVVTGIATAEESDGARTIRIHSTDGLTDNVTDLVLMELGSEDITDSNFSIKYRTTDSDDWVTLSSLAEFSEEDLGELIIAVDDIGEEGAIWSVKRNDLTTGTKADVNIKLKSDHVDDDSDDEAVVMMGRMRISGLPEIKIEVKVCENQFFVDFNPSKEDLELDDLQEDLFQEAIETVHEYFEDMSGRDYRKICKGLKKGNMTYSVEFEFDESDLD